MALGSISSRCPVISPTIASPENSCHQDSVCRSYITRLLKCRKPVVPKSRTSPFTVRLNTKAVLHSGQNVIVTGSPPTTSLTISCQTKIWSG